MASTEGKVTALLVEEGDLVVKDQPLVIVEAMKMEHRHLADGDGGRPCARRGRPAGEESTVTHDRRIRWRGGHVMTCCHPFEYRE